MFRTGKAIRLGIHPRTLCKLRDQGDIQQVWRGLYRLATAQPLTNPDLVPLAVRIPRGVVCLISALAYHNLTTQVPHAIYLALPSHGQTPKTHGLPIRVFWFSERSFSAGIEAVRIDNVPVRIYSVEKTIADCFKYRNKIGLRTHKQRKRRPKLQALTKFAQIDRVLRVMRPYVEAML
jgi:predicted transcriptional regulator of viral defense system